MTILEKIIETKKNELEIVKKTIPIEELKKLPNFERKSISLVDRLKNSSHGIIAEHKRKSPSKSIINDSISINEIITGYNNANVCGISVLTDKDYFGGSLNDLRNARKLTNIPILRKEFIIDEYQIIEAKANGADVILLIAACLEKDQIKSFSSLAKEIGLEVLIEIHDENELKKCLTDTIDIIGVNNRNLKTFEVDINTSIKLSNMIPKKFTKISESGISNYNEIIKLRKYGFKGFLIGELFMKKNNPGKEVFNLIQNLI
ncbi:MAG: indole-3-glycerol phosphate synthase TrpC [Flavobacteriales bacterium]|nr:MAG: indole-3-glycerol phosphate synthase TrpC [Flavobacteriales bacterium]|tara:strand:+ start:660 stop:1442 length:783 start_codon:yes stop_codon:yes gene_type:complete